MTGELIDQNWFQALRHGDERATFEFWDHYYPRLTRVARAMMKTLPRTAYDEEDAAIGTFSIVCEKLREGRYPNLVDHAGVWRLMKKVLHHRVRQRAQYELARKRKLPVWHPSRVEESSVADHYRGEECVEYGDLLTRLNDPHLERLVMWKLEGYTNHEIAGKLNRTRRTVQRSLETVRERWLQELPQANKPPIGRMYGCNQQNPWQLADEMLA